MAFRQSSIHLSQKAKSKSAAWVARQYRDPYVKKRLSDPAAYRARSAFKLLEIDEKSNFLSHPDVNAVVDLGAAPGGWSQVVAGKLGWNPAPPPIAYLSGTKEKISVDNEGPTWSDPPSRKLKGKAKPQTLDEFDPLNIDDLDPTERTTLGRGTIIAVDLLNISPIPGVQTVRGDFMLDSTARLVQGLLCGRKADVILSDIAANSSGNDTHDIQSSLEICETVFDFASRHLRSAEEVGRRKGGALLLKFFAHPLLDSFRDEKLKPNFKYVHYIKPESSRAGSREGYYLCQGFHGTRT